MQAKIDNLITFDSYKPTAMLRFLSALLFMGLSAGLFAQSRMSSTEIGYSYNMDHEFLITERVARAGNRYKVFLRFRLNSGMVKISDYELSYDLRASYIDEKKINGSVVLDTSHVIGNGFREFIYAFEFETTSDQNLLVVQVENITRDRRYMKDILLKSDNGLERQPSPSSPRRVTMPVGPPASAIAHTDTRVITAKLIKPCWKSAITTPQ